jgi:hypothetical protein
MAPSAAVAGAAPSGIGSLAAVASAARSGITGFLAKGLAAYPIATVAVVCSLVVGATLALAKWPAAGPGSRLGSGSGSATPSTTRSAAAPLLTLGPASLEAGTEAGFFVTTAATLGIVAPLSTSSSATARQQATFDVVPGLADPKCFSFRSRDGRYLRHASWRLRLNSNDGSRLFQGDATFCVRPGPTAASVHLESSNYPGWWLHRRGGEVWVDQPDGTVTFPAQSSFRIRPPLAT